MTGEANKTFEMLWDCEYCGAKKLLGLSHRHCPECGAAQDPKRRYFPNDDEKIAVEDHVYVGADVHCPACSAPMSAKVKFCASCGSPLQGGTNVARIDAEAPKTDSKPATKTAAPAGSRTKLWIGLGIGALVVAALLLCLFWKKEVGLSATEHTWKREIKIEKFGPKDDSAWCDEMPAKAYGVARSQEVRSYKELPDGEACTKKKKDNGDGTFTEVNECVPKTRKEPVYSEKCRFKIDAWQYARSAVAEGKGLSSAPTWPKVTLAKTGQGLGAEREGQKVETYTVHFQDTAQKNSSDTCGFDEARWRAIADGSRWKAQKSVVTGLLDCSSLQPAP